MYSTVLYGTVLVYSKCTYGGSTGGCPPWLNENIGGSKGGFPPWLKENIGGSTGGFPPWLNSRTGSPDGSSPTMWAYGSSGLRIESRRRHTFDLHTPDKAQAGAAYEMTNPAHEMRRSTPRLEPVTLTTSRTKIPYHYATGCLSCADRAVIPQRGQ